MHTLFIFLLQVFANEKFRVWAAETLQHFIEKLLRSETKKRKRKAQKKEKKKMSTKLVQDIQANLRSRVQNPNAAILEQAGVFAEINREEGGLNKAEGSFGGITPVTWDEYRKDNPTITIEKPADLELLGAEVAAAHIFHFKMWYFQKPPKRDFFALPPLLWLVACDAAYLSDVPVISRIQKLIGCETIDGIWGSGTTAKVQEYFARKTVPDMIQFAKDLTDLIIERYEEMKKYPQHAANALHWIERAERKINMLLNFVNLQNELADNGENPTKVNEVRSEEASSNDEEVSTQQGAELATEAELEEGKADPPDTAIVPLSDLKVLTEAIRAQSTVISEMQSALLQHVEMQEKILNILTEAQPSIDAETLATQIVSEVVKQQEMIQQQEAALPEKPKSPREELNEFPDSLLP